VGATRRGRGARNEGLGQWNAARSEPGDRPAQTAKEGPSVELSKVSLRKESFLKVANPKRLAS